MRLLWPMVLVIPVLLAMAPAGPKVAVPAPSGTQPADVTAALAAGKAVALIEVTSVVEKDLRPVDGNLIDVIQFKTVKSSGVVPGEIDVTKDFGGLRQGPAPKPGGPLYPNPLVVGGRYWIVFIDRDWEKYQQGVLAWWPEKGAPTEALEAAVTADKFGKAATKP